MSSLLWRKRRRQRIDAYILSSIFLLLLLVWALSLDFCADGGSFHVPAMSRCLFAFIFIPIIYPSQWQWWNGHYAFFARRLKPKNVHETENRVRKKKNKPTDMHIKQSDTALWCTFFRLLIYGRIDPRPWRCQTRDDDDSACFYRCCSVYLLPQNFLLIIFRQR